MAIPRNLANIAPHVNASSTELVVNDGGANLDFRVEGQQGGLKVKVLPTKNYSNFAARTQNRA
jgi:hypothetical protein